MSGTGPDEAGSRSEREVSGDMAAGDPEVAELLVGGHMELKGRIPWSSNATFLVEVGDEGASTLAIYKPEQGERPLWDFHRGLWRREVAAYQLSRQLGWDIVPVTVSRPDAPLGRGSVQLFVDADADQHYFTLVEEPAHLGQLRRIAAFDVVANNADRKSGHCLLGPGERIWAIDHGLTFHREPKLRTVIWDFAGAGIDEDVLSDLVSLAGTDLFQLLDEFLDVDEVEAVRRRAAGLVRRARFPKPGGDFPYPWPLI